MGKGKVEEKRYFNFQFIKTHLKRLLLIPSLLCLDAPLAALGWAATLSSDLARQGLSPTSRTNFAALFLTVWAIYLFDRLFDVYRSQRPEMLTIRHEWARHHRGLLVLLAAASSGILAILILPALDQSTLLAGIGPGLITLLYYLAFRFSGLHAHFFRRVPWKELTIGTCFTMGILIAVYPGAIGMGFRLLAGGLALLFSANCLLISRAEGDLDSSDDPAAHFAGGRPEKDFHLPERLVFLSMIVGIPVATGGGFVLSSTSLFACGVMTFFLARTGRDDQRSLMQPSADGIQLFPWLLVASEAIGTRLNV